MNVNQAVAKRIEMLLKERDITQYRLEQKSGVLHGSLACIMNGRNKTVTLSTVYMIAKGFDMTIVDFLNHDINSGCIGANAPGCPYVPLILKFRTSVLRRAPWTYSQ